ncbi:MAG: SRPBCC family protein [Flavobacteriales bacterium]
MSKLQARNEMVINAPISKVWALITDINQLHKINPGVLSATGSMNQLNATRTCEMDNKGRKGTMTEKLIELVHEQKIVWAIENDTMGMAKMLKDPRFCFYLEKEGENKTKIINESYYVPATFAAKIMNALMMKRMMGRIQGQILNNIKKLAERN